MSISLYSLFYLLCEQSYCGLIWCCAIFFSFLSVFFARRNLCSRLSLYLCRQKWNLNGQLLISIEKKLRNLDSFHRNVELENITLWFILSYRSVESRFIGLFTTGFKEEGNDQVYWGDLSLGFLWYVTSFLQLSNQNAPKHLNIRH